MLSVFIFNGFFIITTLIYYYRFLDIRVVYHVILTSLLLEFIFSLLSLSFISSLNINIYLNLGFLSIDSFSINSPFILIFDTISGFFHIILFVALISCFCFLISYFEYDFNSINIILLSSLFSQLAFLFFCSYDIFSMIFLWEYISIVSFLLIQHWLFRITTIKASLKVFCISQFGDFFFLSALFILCFIFETTDITVINSNKFFLYFYYIKTYIFIVPLSNVLSILLISALFLKAAQFFFFPWLLDAMEAPVPISAQLHSSTLVIIGFYVFCRFFDIIFFNNNVYYFFFLFSYFTIVSSSILGFFQDDGKKLLACSTASQLGYVILAFSLNFFYEGLLLLFFCCTNKAFIFIWFGIIMNKNNGISDFRLLKTYDWSFLDKSGLVISALSSTLIPGSYSWHIKSLMYRGSLKSDFFFTSISIEVLSLTWLFSSLYIFKLVFSIISIPTRGSYYKLKNSYNFSKVFNFSINNNSIVVLSIINIFIILILPNLISSLIVNLNSNYFFF